MVDLYRNFTGRDFSAGFERLLTLLRDPVDGVPELTDLNHSDAGVSLLRLEAREVDQLMFYLDEAFQEGYVGLAKYKQSLCDLAKLVGYPPKLASSATDTITVTRVPGELADVSIPKYTAFTRSDGKSYLATQDYILPAGTDTLNVEVIEGALVELSIPPSEFALVDRSGHPKYNLGANVAFGTVLVSHGSPVVDWTEVDCFWRSRNTDNHFALELFADNYNGDLDTVFLVVGDGVEGSGLPAVNLFVKFIRTSGASGNTGGGTISRVPSSLDGLVTCTNTYPATGGAAAETLENLRTRIPLVTRTQRRGVTTADYSALVESIPGVLHCQCVDRNHGLQWPHEYVVLFVVPEGGCPMSAPMYRTIMDQLKTWGHFGDWEMRYLLNDATSVPVNISCRIGLRPGYDSTAVCAAVQAALSALISPYFLGVGDTLSYTQLHMTASAVPGVAWAEFSAPTNDVTSGIGEMLTPGTISVVVGS